MCVGIDPHPGLMPELFGGPYQAAGSNEAIKNLEAFAHSVLDAASGRVPAIKPQVAFFERHGPEGLRILANLSTAAKQRNLLVIMDGKRGNIDAVMWLTRLPIKNSLRAINTADTAPNWPAKTID